MKPEDIPQDAIDQAVAQLSQALQQSGASKADADEVAPKIIAQAIKEGEVPGLEAMQINAPAPAPPTGSPRSF